MCENTTYLVTMYSTKQMNKINPTFSLDAVPVLNEGTEWRQACARSDHDDRHGWLEGQAELRFAHKYRDGRSVLFRRLF